MSYVNPLSIFKSICPDKMLAANLRPSETFLAKYDMNSINTNSTNKGKGQPEGTNRENSFSLCIMKPNIVAPRTIVKLSEKVNTK